MGRESAFLIVLLIILAGSSPLSIKVQSAKASGIIYIRIDGSIDPPTAPLYTPDNVTYTLTSNIISDTGGIVIERDNIVVDGAGYNVTGSYSGNGATLADRSNVTIRNMTIENFVYGIWLGSSSNNTLSGNNLRANTELGILLSDSSNITLSGNNVTNNRSGLGLGDSSDSTLIGNNVTNNRYDGIYLVSSVNNTLSRNNLSGNEFAGISLHSSPDNVLSGNTIEGSRISFAIYGFTLSDYINSIDSSNLINAKPIYYLMNQSNIVISPHAYPEIGYLGLVNCANVTVQGLNLNGNSDGLLLASTNNSKITGNNITNNDCGIRLLWQSSNNTLSGNNVTNNGDGIDLLQYSSFNTLSSNYVANNWGSGILLGESSYNALSGNMVADNWDNGILLGSSPHNTLVGNNVTNNTCYGISLFFALHNTLSGNNITDNDIGIIFSDTLYHSHNNSVTGNNIANNRIGIDLSGYSNIHANRMFHNNFLNNTEQVSNNNIEQASNLSVNVWDDGYPSGGNYWSDYNGTDANHDGIGDTPYTIDANNTDNYPLMGMFHGYTILWQEETYTVALISNSTVSGIGHTVLTASQLPNFTIIEESFESIFFRVSGEEGTYGFCRVQIPVALLNNTYRVTVNGTEVPYTLFTFPNSTDSWLYFTYTHPTERVEITPEFPSFLILPLFLMATLLAAITYRKKYRYS